MTILKPSIHQHVWHIKNLVQKYKLASLFAEKPIVKIDYFSVVFTSSISAKV